ncbi:YraN family protein [Anaerovibrio sp.]|uniref:YraN family protein n=1 Tax=Anaerovibrio sp. TaxID=1872532 RepID=UPI003F18ED10
MDSKELGRRGEALAAQYLATHGCSIVEQNYRCPAGEIDIIARCGELVIFAEVKTRRSGRFGRPGAAVDSFKQQKIIRSAGWYIRGKGLEGSRFRFDVLEVMRTPAGQMSVNHIRGAFEA